MKTSPSVISPEAQRKHAQRVNKCLPQSPTRWAKVVAHVVKNASPRRQMELKKVQRKGQSHVQIRSGKKRGLWREKVHFFLRQDDISRKMPNKKDVIHEDGYLIAKRHLLFGKKEAYMKLLKVNPNYPLKYTTFRNSVPRHIQR